MVFGGERIKVRYHIFLWSLVALGGCPLPDFTSTTETDDAGVLPGPVADLIYPDHFPAPPFPEDNPWSAEKAELGRYLFFDFRLAINGKRSCGICHEPIKGWTDGFVRSVGATDDLIPLNSISVVNVAYKEQLTWRDPSQRDLETQMDIPLFGTHPLEMGMLDQESLLVDRLEATDFYLPLFEAGFPGEEIDFHNIKQAIATFERSIIGGQSTYDRFLQGVEPALTEEEERGRQLFFSDELKCGRCHGGLFFDQTMDAEGLPLERHGYFNTGLYDIDGLGAYPPEEIGLKSLTGLEEDMGVFRVPSLRNVENTSPYAHDGTVAALGDMIDNYARGGRLVESGPYPGDGATNPFKSSLIQGFEITAEDKEALLGFLHTLSDLPLNPPPHLASPFCETNEDGQITNAPCYPRFETD